MKLTVKKNMTEEERKALAQALQPPRTVRLARYFGKIPSIGDPLRFQKNIRDEWG